MRCWNKFLNWLIPNRRQRILAKMIKQDQELGLYDEPNEVEVLIRRLKRIGIEIVLQGNIPFVYLDKVNNNTVQPEDFNANHGYTIAWYKDEVRLDHDRKEMFRIIRKYK